ncbi:MAG: hypothetical protein ABMB14_38435 [Myxococcota bacterium]
MVILVLVGCERDGDPGADAFSVPIPDRSRYAGCTSDLRSEHAAYTSLDHQVYDPQGWPFEHRSDYDADGDDDQIDRYEERNAYGLYTEWTSDYVGVSVESTTATYDGAFWTAQDRWIDGRLDQRWTYTRPSERELVADVDLDGDGVVERSWRQSLNDEGRPELEELTDVDGRWISDERWTWSGDRLVEDVYQSASGGWSVTQSWTDAPGPDHATLTWFDEDGATELVYDATLAYDAAGREASSTAALDLDGDGVVDETVASTTTWSCP